MAVDQLETPVSGRPPTRPGWPLAVAGAIAGGVSLAVGELFAGLVEVLPSLVSGVATFVIDHVPSVVKEFAIRLFGTNDKVALAVGIVITTMALAALVGTRSRALPWLVPAAFFGFGLAGALAAARTPLSAFGPAFVNGMLASAAGVLAFRLMARPVSEAEETATDLDRRLFLGRAGAIALLALIGAGAGRALFERTRRLVAGREQVQLPVASGPLPSIPDGASLDLPGISPIITPNADFYRIDTAPIAPPSVDLASWRLKITGLVDRELELDFNDISDLPMVERTITISCVSNQVGGDLVGTAEWLGTPLGDLLRRAGIRPDASQIVGRSVDGFTVGFPVAAVSDGRDALLAIGMNGEPLPFEHGFPARLVVAGLYGYVSATKWLSEIEVTTWDAFDAYWIPRGWSKEGPVKTQSRIDTPTRSTRLSAGPVGIGGVAWAPTRGIDRVEVRVDEGPWMAADLGDSIGDEAWRQWSIVWDATPGNHQVQVRATDGTGVTQPEERTPVAPNGATGYHTVTYAVEA